MESDFNKERSKYKETDVEIDFSTTNWRHRLLWELQKKNEKKKNKEE